MEEILIEQEYISNEKVNECIGAFHRLKDQPHPVLKIVAKKQLQDTNILLPAYLLLFKSQVNNIQIEIHLNRNDKEGPNRKAVFKLINYRVYAYLMLETEPFKLFLSERDNPEPLFERGNQFPPGSLVLSESFMMLFLVSDKKDKIKGLLFENDPELNEANWFMGGLEFQLADKTEDTYAIYRDHLAVHTTAENPFNAIANLGRLSFLDALKETGIISYYLASHKLNDEELREMDFRIGRLRSKVKDGEKDYKPFNYYSRIRYIFDELRRLPLVYPFVFSQLVSSKLLPKLGKDTSETTARAVENLWRFTKDLCYSLKELANNIIQHSSEHMGVISANFVKKEGSDVWTGLSPLLTAYTNELTQVVGIPEALLEFHVCDLGKKGITSTLLKSTEDYLQNIETDGKLAQLLKDDIKVLKENELSFRHLISPTGIPILYQQSKRSIAHLGLLFFNKLVRKNEGLIIASSPDINGNPKIETDPQILDLAPDICYGTRISFALPVFTNRPYRNYIPHPVQIPAQGAPLEIKGLESIFSLIHITSEWGFSTHDKNQIYLLNIEIGQTEVKDRAEESKLWSVIGETVQKLEQKFADNYSIDNGSPGLQLIINIDLRKCRIEASKLFRLLGNMEIGFPNHTTLITNIPNEVFRELIETNKIYMKLYEDLKMPFWSEQNVNLIYHYLHLPGGKFYFTDALWGKSKREFYQLNQLIQRNHFNAITISDEEYSLYPDFDMTQFRNLENSSAFYNNHILLPLDLLLKADEERTIFECNSFYLLNNEIKPNTIL